MTHYVVGLDLGTTSVKAIALDEKWNVLASSSATNTLFTREPGSGYQDPCEIWNSTVKALTGLAGQVPARKAVGICLSGAMHSVFPLDSDGEPRFPAVTWADVRAGRVAQALRQRCDAHALYLRTGCPLEYLYHPAKINRWIEETPGLAKSRFAAIKDYVIYRLCGAWVTDQGLSSATGLMDTRQGTWDDEALALAGICSEQLPKLVSPTAIVGGLSTESASLTGFPQGLPIVAGAGDGGLANLGAGAIRPGQTVITVGTSGAVRRILSEPRMDEKERTWCYRLLDGRWFYGGATNNAGLAVKWIRDQFYGDIEGAGGYERLMEEAGEIPAGAEGVVIAPYFAGERNPHWNADARATFTGLRLEHNRRHIARAILEGTGYCLVDIWDAMGDDPDVSEDIHLTGTINQSPLWAQILCDQIGLPLVGVEAADASAVGAGVLGLAGLDKRELDEFAQSAHPIARYVPDRETHRTYRVSFERFREIYSLA